jgi:anthranilate phosphoribosyltransferase
MIKEAIKKLVEKESLTSDEASAVMEEIMSGEATPSQLASFITALRMRQRLCAGSAGSEN